MKKKQKSSLKEIEEFLDSDDEFPDYYYEIDEVPAYLDDDRFEEFKFTWITDNKYKIQQNESKSIKEEPKSIGEESKSIGEEPKSIGEESKSIGEESKSIGEEPKLIEVEPIKRVKEKKLCNRSVVKGTLNKCDILCLKSVEKMIPNDILLWFAKFLLFKDMQSHFTTPKSCLISEPVSLNIGNQEMTTKKSNSNKAKFTYRVIISKEND